MDISEGGHGPSPCLKNSGAVAIEQQSKDIVSTVAVTLAEDRLIV